MSIFQGSNLSSRGATAALAGAALLFVSCDSFSGTSTRPKAWNSRCYSIVTSTEWGMLWAAVTPLDHPCLDLALTTLARPASPAGLGGLASLAQYVLHPRAKGILGISWGDA